MNSECMKVLALGIFRAKSTKLTADQSKWHKLFLDLKQSGVDPRILGQLRFREPSGGRAFSDDVEQLLFVVTRAEGSTRDNPVLQVIELKPDAREQFQNRYHDVERDHEGTISAIAEAVDARLRLV